jgi:hypothetical protein
MTMMIYRGFEHDGVTARQAAGRHELIYRGVRHDGLASPRSADPAGIRLVYRGFGHPQPHPAATRESPASAALPAV